MARQLYVRLDMLLSRQLVSLSKTYARLIRILDVTQSLSQRTSRRSQTLLRAQVHESGSVHTNHHRITSEIVAKVRQTLRNQMINPRSLRTTPNPGRVAMSLVSTVARGVILDLIVQSLGRTLMMLRRTNSLND
jgi:hypothetical protein